MYMFFYILIFLLIVSHELGHFLAGWYLGIPKDRMKIQLFKYPPQVLLIDDSGAKIPLKNFEKYLEILERYFSSEKDFWLYITGGHIFEFVVALALSIFAFLSDLLPVLAVRSSVRFILLISLIYIVIDIIVTLYLKNPFGDFSGAWMTKPFATLIFYFLYFGGYIWLYIFLKAN